jgi:hypothetical protein
MTAATFNGCKDAREKISGRALIIFKIYLGF